MRGENFTIFRFSRRSLLAAAFLATAACSERRPASLQVPLEMKITETRSPLLSGATMPIFIMPVIDLRQDQTSIGENREDSPYVPIYPSGQPVADFVQAGLADQLHRDGLGTVTNPNDAARVMQVKLQTFWAEETPLYHARISADIVLMDPNGKTLWSKTVEAGHYDPGAPLKPVHYQEALSDAMADFVRNLVTDPDFQQAVTAAPASEPSTQPR